MNRNTAKRTAPPLQVGDVFPARDLPTLSSPVRVPDGNELVHLQLRRYAGCPICSLHLRSFARRIGELKSAGVVEVAVFHSSRKELQKVHARQPFFVVPDPERHLYTELGIEHSLKSVLHPRAWLSGTLSLFAGTGGHAVVGSSDGGLGLPGDFLISPSGQILALHRGSHADDQWSVDEVLSLASGQGAT